MPICFLEVPTGIHPDAKKKLVKKITTALNETWPIPDVRVFFREYRAEDVAQDGDFRSDPMKPICFLDVPLLRSLDTKRKLTQALHAAFVEAYEGIANTSEFMIFYNLYPLENASVGARLQSDNPQAVEGMTQLKRHRHVTTAGQRRCRSPQCSTALVFLGGALRIRIGEIGLAGVAPAITAAVHHATGVRVRELPVKIENLLS